ncbi:MAG: EAL domain-containing protein [Colwellia sp.]|nr:EAL domain-containing protein [Colwellia sp.]
MKKNVFFIICLPLIFSLLVNPVYGKNLTNNASHFLKRLSPNEGLSQSHVNKTIQDSQGFIWVATKMGLNRFDGYQVKSFDGPNGIFTAESITTLFLDEQQNLWVSTLYSGLFRINTTTLNVEQVFNGRLSSDDTTVSEVIAIEQGGKNKLWLGISEHVYSLDTLTGKLTHYLTLNLKDNIVRALLLEGNWLFCATGRGLYRLNIANGDSQFISHQTPEFNSEDSENAKFLLRDKELGLLMGTVEGLFQLQNITDNNVENLTSQLLVEDLNIWDMILDGNGYLIATNKGLYRFNRDNLILSPVLKFSDSRFQITDNTILDIFKDKIGNIWLASKSQGVMIWSPKTLRFDHVSASTIPALSHDNVWAVYQDNNDIVWLGTDNGLNRLDLVNGTSQSFLTTNDSKAIHGSHVIHQIFAFPNDSNKLWLENDYGLQIFDTSTNTLSQPKYSKKMAAIVNEQWPIGYYIVDNSNILFITSESHYLYNSLSGEVESLTELNKVSSPELSWGFLPSFTGLPYDVLLASSGKLYLFNLKNKQSKLIYQVKNYQAQNSDFVDNWLVDHNDTLWLAMSGEGLIGLDKESFKEKYRFEISNKMPTANIYSLQMDDFNNLWFSSQVGLFRLNLDNNHLEHFTADDGLLANEYNSSAYTKLSDDRLVFGSTRGITLFSPHQFVASSDVDKDFDVTLTDIELLSNDERKFPPLGSLKKLVLDYNEYGIRLEFSTLQYFRQLNTLYDVRLEGPESLHYKDYAKNELLLPKLTPGNYQLEISAFHPVTGKRSEPYILEIESLAAPWQTTKAKIFYLLLIVLIIALYIYRRNARRHTLLLAHEKTKASEQRMSLALKSSNSGIWDYHVTEDELYDKRLTDELSYTSLKQPHKLVAHLERIRYDDFNLLEQRWHDFVEGNIKRWDVSYQMLAKDGQWLWFRDVGRIISTDKQGKPTRLAGTYTNITQSKDDKAKAVLFGEAFSQINDWVLIVDARLVPVSANDTFLNAFSSRKSGDIPSFKQIVGSLGEQKFQEFREIIEKIKPGESWQGEEVIATKHESQHPVLIKINAIVKDSGKISHYVIVISDITIQKNAEEKLRHLAHYDYLTNLPNRKLILEKIEQTIKDHQRSEKKSALFFIDLDKFKQVNDSLGHSVGDDLLRYVAHTLVTNVKARDLVARQSGDEFMILIDEFEDLDHLIQLAQRIIKRLSQPLKLMGSHVNVSASIGIAIYPDDADNSAELIQKADLAMIHAKETGRSRFEFFTASMNEKAQQRIALEGQVQLAFNNEEFINYYQPIVDCAHQRIIGFELLMRWPSDNGFISPEVFIPITEDMGLISKLTERAIDQALTDYCRWQGLYENSYVSINLSAIHILQEGLASTLEKLLIKHELTADVVRLEITEGTLLSDKSIALLRLNELKALGFKLLLDDFGTGYSSLTYLSKFPIDIIKIDQSFIRNLQSNPMNKPIIKSIVSLANNLDLTCIAEGVETQKQLNYIRSLNCDVIQGYYFSKPVPIDEIICQKFKSDIHEFLSVN